MKGKVMEAERIRRGNSNTHAYEKNEKAELRKKRGFDSGLVFLDFFVDRSRCKVREGVKDAGRESSGCGNKGKSLNKEDSDTFCPQTNAYSVHVEGIRDVHAPQSIDGSANLTVGRRRTSLYKGQPADAPFDSMHVWFRRDVHMPSSWQHHQHC